MLSAWFAAKLRSRKGSISTGSNECCQWPCAERTGPRHHHANSCAQLGHLQLLPWHTISFSFSPPLAAGTSGAADEGPLLAMDMRSGGSPAGRIGPSGAKQDVLASMHAAAPHLSHLISTDRGRRFDRPDDRSGLCSHFSSAVTLPLCGRRGKRFVWAKFLAQEEAFLNEEPACQWPRGSLSNAAAASESAGRIVTQNASKLRGLQCTPQKHAGSTGRLGVACINRTPPETRMSAVARDDDAPSCCAQVRERTTGSKISHPAQSCNNAELHVREPAVRGGAVGPHMH